MTLNDDIKTLQKSLQNNLSPQNLSNIQAQTQQALNSVNDFALNLQSSWKRIFNG